MHTHSLSICHTPTPAMGRHKLLVPAVRVSLLISILEGARSSRRAGQTQSKLHIFKHVFALRYASVNAELVPDTIP